MQDANPLESILASLPQAPDAAMPPIVSTGNGAVEGNLAPRIGQLDQELTFSDRKESTSIKQVGQEEEVLALKKQVAALERDLKEAQEGAAIQHSRFEAEVRLTSHLQKKYDHAMTEVQRLRDELAMALGT